MVTRTHWPAVFLAIMLGSVGATALGKIPAVLGALRGEFGLSLLEGGWVATVFSTLAAACSVFFGLLLVRWSALQTVIAGALIMMGGGLLAIPAQSLGGLLASRVIEGVGYLTLSVSLPTLIDGATQPRDKRLSLSLWAVSVPLGAGIGLIATPSLASWFGWRGAWLVLDGLLLAGLLALLAACRGLPVPQRPRLSFRAVVHQLRVLRQGGVWRFGGAFLIYTTLLWSIFVWLPTMLRLRPELGAAQIALMSALVVLANVPGNLLGAFLLSRGLQRERLMGAALTLMALCGVAAFWPGASPHLAYALCIAASFFGGGAPPAILSSSQQLSKSSVEVALVQGFYVQIANIGQMSGPLLLAALVSWSGDWSITRWLFVTGAVLATMLSAYNLRR